MTSCHSRYVYLDYEVHSGPMWNNEHNSVAFIASKTAHRSASGISSFPDGGIPEYLIKNVGLYVFNVTGNKLTQLISFDELTELIGTSRINWSSQIAFTDSAIYYRLMPAKYSKTFAYSTNLNKVFETDSSLFSTMYNKSIIANKADLSDLNKRLAGIPVADWGFLLNEIYPKTDQEYIEETIYMRNNSSMTRQAVVEQIIAKMSKNEISDLVNKMEEYKNSLKGLKKMEFEIYSKETYERIQRLR